MRNSLRSSQATNAAMPSTIIMARLFLSHGFQTLRLPNPRCFFPPASCNSKPSSRACISACRLLIWTMSQKRRLKRRSQESNKLDLCSPGSFGKFQGGLFYWRLATRSSPVRERTLGRCGRRGEGQPFIHRRSRQSARPTLLKRSSPKRCAHQRPYLRWVLWFSNLPSVGARAACAQTCR